MVQYHPNRQAYPVYRNNAYMPFSPNGGQQQNQQEFTPYDFFFKPEFPTQYFMPQQNNPQSSINTGEGNENNPLNFDTVISKVGQIASTYHQVSPIVKEFSTFVKGFR